ncbi:hypothetical protein [Nonomuraea lactucae]|uniref:hypothetical protein n=1 Tax=Nonomuraea lactucae TaxID=2249762 RepID=UPI000DE31FDC|nr:hypothetical protein [Nonomuraea lactucae]
MPVHGVPPGPACDHALLEAARNNAEWCDAMCLAHDIRGVFAPHAWTAPVRTPPYYPDAVTLSPDATERDVLDAIDQGPGASVKDSFATLDLRPSGFEVLFEAQWIHRPAPERAPGDVAEWDVVRDAATLRAWESACFDGAAGTRLFRPPLLTRQDVAVLSGHRDGEIVYGSVLNLSGRVAGLSNLFARDGDDDAAWTGTLAMAAELFPGRPLVGYEVDVDPARRHGFVVAGPLRVWLKAPGAVPTR